MTRKITAFILAAIFSFVFTGCPIPPTPPEPTPPPEPPTPTIPTISQNIRPITMVQRHGYPVYLFTVFFPEFLYAKATTKEDLIAFWDRVAEADACNGTRLFIGHTAWAGKYEPWIHKPFMKGSDGRFILPDPGEPITDYINPEWKQALLTRLKILRDREIFRSIDLWDYCQMHRRHNTSWDTHWINGKNNTKGTADDPEAVFYYSRSDAGTAWKQTGKYVEKFTRYLVKTIWEEEAKHTRPGWNTSLGFNPGNEVLPSKVWNDRIIEIIDEEIAKITPGVQMYRWQKIASPLPWENLDKKFTEKNLFQLHQVNSHATYQDWKGQLRIPRFMASLDGARDENGNYFLIEKAAAMKLFKQILADKNFGLELRVGHGHGTGRLPSAANGWKYNLTVIDLTVPIAIVNYYKQTI